MAHVKTGKTPHDSQHANGVGITERKVDTNEGAADEDDAEDTAANSSKDGAYNDDLVNSQTTKAAPGKIGRNH